MLKINKFGIINLCGLSVTRSSAGNTYRNALWSPTRRTYHTMCPHKNVAGYSGRIQDIQSLTRFSSGTVPCWKVHVSSRGISCLPVTTLTTLAETQTIARSLVHTQHFTLHKHYKALLDMIPRSVLSPLSYIQLGIYINLFRTYIYQQSSINVQRRSNQYRLSGQTIVRASGTGTHSLSQTVLPLSN